MAFTKSTIASKEIQCKDLEAHNIICGHNGVGGTIEFVDSGGTSRNKLAPNYLIFGGTSPASCAAIQINSDTKGLLLSNLTTTQRNAISSPNRGLLIMNETTEHLEYYDGSDWREVASLSDL